MQDQEEAIDGLVEEETLEADWLDQGSLDSLIEGCLSDFHETKEDDSALAKMVAEVAKNSISKDTHKGHKRCVVLSHSAERYLDQCDRIIKAYIAYHRKGNAEFDPKAKTELTPHHIRQFILESD